MNSAELKVPLRILFLRDIKTATILTVFLLKGIKFPIICDRDGDFSRAFGVLKVSGENLGAARAVFETLVQFLEYFLFHHSWPCSTLRRGWST